MTTIEEHQKIVNELVGDVEEKIRRDIVAQKQKIIGFSTSEASTNLFAILLHKNRLIEPGFNVNYNYFLSLERANSRFSQKFPKKGKIIELLIKQEEYRVLLCYGREKSSETVNSAIKNFFELKKVIEEATGDLDEKE